MENRGQKSSKDSLATLFETEKLPPVHPSGPLKVIDLSPSKEALEAAKAKRENWEEKRQFTRAELSDENKIHLSFSNQQQFAKQYIENISLGGLFVRTKMRPGLGALVPISFTIPISPMEDKEFNLQAKVCRQTDQGLGLEFLDLTTEMRKQLEYFVKHALPEGTPVLNQVKKGSVERLESLRNERQVQIERRKKILLKLAFAGALFVLNTYLGIEVSQEFRAPKSATPEAEVVVDGHRMPQSSIVSVQRDAQGEFIIQKNDGTYHVLKQNEINSSNLPPHLLKSVEVLRMKSLSPHTRKTKNQMRKSSSLFE